MPRFYDTLTAEKAAEKENKTHELKIIKEMYRARVFAVSLHFTNANVEWIYVCILPACRTFFLFRICRYIMFGERKKI